MPNNAFSLNAKPIRLWAICVFLFASILQWIVGQGGAIFDYDLVAGMGFHPIRSQSDPISIAVTRGIAFADTVIQLPFFIIGLVGLMRRKFYGAVAAWIALGMNLYWTTVAWAKKYFYIQAGFDTAPHTLSLHAGLAFILIFSAWAMLYLYRKRALFE